MYTGPMSSQSQGDPPSSVVVIGAGVVGLCAARWLQREGFAVTVADPAPPGESCSFGNAGIIATGAVAPVAMPGVFGKLPRWLFDPVGPLRLRWGYLPRLLPWLLRFVAAARPARVAAIADALRALNAPALDAWRALLGPADFADLIRAEGLVYVYRDEAARKADSYGWALRRARGVAFRPLDAAALRAVEPALGPGWTAAMLLEDGGHTVDPLRLSRRLAERFVADGGRLVAARVTGLDVGGDGRVAVRTDQGGTPPGRVVVAAGAWSRPLARMLGARVPLDTERGYHVTLPNPGVTLRRPVAAPDLGFIATPMAVGLRIAGTVEFGGLEAPPDMRRARALLRHGRALFPGLCDSGASTWMGFRPSLPDSLPVIGRARPGVEAWLAFGHGHLGLTEGAITGRLVAEMIAGRAPAIDVAPYRPDRF